MHIPFKYTLLSAIACACVAPADAAWNTIYSDDFSGSSGTSLNGLAPDVAPGAETWTLNDAGSFDSWKADGSALAGGAGALGQTSMQLPFSLTAGNVYQLSARVAPTSSTGQWIAFGFSDRLTSSAGASGLFAFGQVNGVSWLFYGDTSSGGQFNAFGGPDTANPIGGSYAGGGNLPADFRILLDTTGSLWKTSLFITPNGGSETQIGSTFNYAANPTINAVGFSKGQNVAGLVDNFQLQVQVVPEPTALSLGLLGGLALLFARRRE